VHEADAPDWVAVDDELSSGRPFRVKDSVELGEGDDLAELSEAVFPNPWSVEIEPHGDQDDAGLDLDVSRLP
jgi:hypothetical protein